LEAEQVRRLCELFSRAEALIEGLLANYPHRVILTYEQAFTDGVLNSEAIGLLSAAAGQVIRALSAQLRATIGAKRQVISNYDEVCEIAAAVKFLRSTSRLLTV